ncbi:hypothetical protein ACFV2I_35455 [Streptomyces microflavus]
MSSLVPLLLVLVVVLALVGPARPVGRPPEAAWHTVRLRPVAAG